MGVIALLFPGLWNLSYCFPPHHPPALHLVYTKNPKNNKNLLWKTSYFLLEMKHSPWKLVVGRLLSYWGGNFSGTMLNFGRANNVCPVFFRRKPMIFAVANILRHTCGLTKWVLITNWQTQSMSQYVFFGTYLPSINWLAGKCCPLTKTNMVMEQVYEVYFNNVGYYAPLYLYVYMYGVYHTFKNMHLYINMYCLKISIYI